MTSLTKDEKNLISALRSEMGIKDINTLIKTRGSLGAEVFKTVSLDHLEGHGVAVDAVLILHIIAFNAKAKLVKRMTDLTQPLDPQVLEAEVVKLFITEYVFRLIDRNITPVFIWDGINKIGKEDTISKRIEDKAIMLADVEAMLAKLQDPVARFELSPELDKTLRSKMSQTVELPFSLGDTLRHELYLLGVPQLISPGDAEAVCSALAHQGDVIGVISRDTDCYCLGCPLLLSEWISGSKGFKAIYLLDILTSLNLSHSQFIDLCILLGTDFNTRIPGIGPVKAYSLIVKYTCIEAIPDSELITSKQTRSIQQHRADLRVDLCRANLTPMSYPLLETIHVDRDKYQSRVLSLKRSWK